MMTKQIEDFHFSSGNSLSDLGGSSKRFQRNVEAIKLLQKFAEVPSNARSLSEDECLTLARYTGWGDSEVLNRLFPRGTYSWVPLHSDLQDVLTTEEREAIVASALNAHYTSLPIIAAIYAGLEHAGIGFLSQFRVLEPAAGIGHFLGMMPAALTAKAERYAVENEPLAARILQCLYPQTRVFSQSFETTALPNDYFDLIVSNVPFGNYPIHDPQFKEKHLKAAIHDYYFARGLRLLRPGGVLAFITSRYTLDKVNDRVRSHLVEQAEFLAAVRLPARAFHKNAGTEVIVDVVFLRKRSAPRKTDTLDESEDWLATELWAEQGTGVSVPLNRHFVKHPQYLLGRPVIASGMHQANEFTLKPDDRDLGEALRNALCAQLSVQCLSLPVSSSPARSLAVATAEPSNGEMALMTLAGSARVRAPLLLDLYTTAKQVIQLQLHNATDKQLAEAQRELNALYLRFTARYGYINAKQNLKDLDRRSPLVPFLRALEEPAGKGSWKKSTLFTQRTIRPNHRAVQSGSAKEALLVCLNEFGEVDLARIAELTGQTSDETADSLQGLSYELPSGLYQTAEEYLSGNVGQKLREAERAASLNPRFQANVGTLAKVQPKPLGPEEIAARLGAGWIPSAFVKAFIAELVPQFQGEVQYIESLSIWKLEAVTHYARSSIEATQTYGTSRANAFDLLEDTLNLRTPDVFDLVMENGNERRVVNDNETLAAQAKQTELKAKFTEWVWKDEQRARELCALYNERFNCLRERRYDGSHLHLPGMNGSIVLRSHQKDGIWRILQSKATLLGHCVGAGKTYLMIAAALELKRLGLCCKTVVVVPNHLPAQWEAETRRLYPNINLLAPTKEDLSAAQRGELMARIATGDYDLIIVPHSAFKLLPLAQETVARYIQREIDTLEAYLEEIPPAEQRANNAP
ncbi:MAG: N-6 DNA methylase [Acidobacteria bacterium]|nr:N-6 DNA methylase [Acidobacteriota bacterium]